MKLAVDIGNTSINAVCLLKKRITPVYQFSSQLSQREIKKHLEILVRRLRKKGEVDEIIVCSVVPKVEQVVVKNIEKLLSLKPKVVGRDLKVPIKNNYDRPKEVGEDRLIGAYAAKCLYGAPAIVIDFGTAITLDIISSKGAYEGGLIIPGIQLSVESLFQRAALLPKVKMITKPKSLIGKNTKESILCGIFYGYGAMCQGLIDTLSSKFKKKPVVIVTGGYTHLMASFIGKRVDYMDSQLVFKGLGLLCESKVL